MFICSLLEELKPEESARNIIVDRGKCVNSSKDWSSRIGNICDGIFRKDGFFYLDENVTQEDAEWPLKVFKISKGVRERIPYLGLKNVRFGRANRDYDDDGKRYINVGWTEGIRSITVEQYLGSLLSIEARHGCDYWNQMTWALARRSLYLLLPITHVQMHSQNTSAHSLSTMQIRLQSS